LVNLDRVLISPEWGQHFPLCNVLNMRRIRSDHSPILLKTEDDATIKGAHFQFEREWLLIPTFKEVVYKNMAEIFLSNNFNNALDMRQVVMANLIKFLRGYEASVRGFQRKIKEELNKEISRIDDKAERGNLKEEEWAERYRLEDQLVELLK
jgi:hypothetical protein